MLLNRMRHFRMFPIQCAHSSLLPSSPLMRESPEVGYSFYKGTIQEMLALAGDLPDVDELSLSSPTRKFKLLQYLTAFSLGAQFMAECVAIGFDFDQQEMRAVMAELRQALAAFAPDEVDHATLDGAFVAVFWALDGLNISALPDVAFRVTEGRLWFLGRRLA